MIIKPDKHWLIWDFAHGVDINLLVFIGFFFFLRNVLPEDDKFSLMTYLKCMIYLFILVYHVIKTAAGGKV